MNEETISREGNVLIRRLVLMPGETTRWHVDSYRRICTVIRGDRLRIEYRHSNAEADEFEVLPGFCGWDEPTDRVHCAVNPGRSVYEEVTVFFLDAPDAEPQPRFDDQA